MQVDIYIMEKSGSREIRVPILPEEIKFHSGNAVFISHDIMGIGEVSVPSGTDLGEYSWESEFPGALRKNDPMMRGKWQDPKNYVNILDDWKRNGTELTLLVTGYPINKDVYVEEFEPIASGAFGDIAYEIRFIEARSVTIATASTGGTTTTSRSTTTSKSYTIKSGDTLWAIAYKYYGTGTKWQTIYNANKDIIEQTAKSHGKSSSQNGHWIYPGTKITIP